MTTTLPIFTAIYSTKKEDGAITVPETSTEIPGNGSSNPHITLLPPAFIYNRTQKSITELLYNGTGYYLDDEDETGLTDLHTLLLACFATTVFLAVTVSTAFGIRLLWKKYRRSKQNLQYDGILHREGTSESISRPLHSHLLEDKNGLDSHLSVNTEDLEIFNGAEINTQVRSNSHSNTNGSIITMTLKNNHLIVETEERNDLEEDSRETTMKYSPSTRDGVFVVEVQQGMRRSPGSGGPAHGILSVGDQCALVHNPPEKYSDDETLEEYDESEYCIEMISSDTPDSISFKAKTGLSQSTTSLTHPSYCYTNQQCYDIDNYGSSQYKGYLVCNYQAIPKPIEDNKPKIMAAIYKNTLKRSPSTEDLHMASINGGLVEDSFVQKELLQRSINDKRPTPESSKIVEKAKIATELSAGNSNPIKEAETKSEDYENKGFECNDSAGS